MSTTQKRTPALNPFTGEEVVTKEQLICFVHNLAEDACRTEPLIKWRLDADAGAGAGPNAFCTNGLAKGALIRLSTITENGQRGVRMFYLRHGQIVCDAKELNGDPRNQDHLAYLHRIVANVVHTAQPEVSQKPVTLAEAMKSINPRAPEERLRMRVGDVFRKVTPAQMVDFILRKPSMLSINVAEGSPEFARLEALIRATVLYIQNVTPCEPTLLLQHFVLKSLADGRMCGHLVTSPMDKIANAQVKFDEKSYGGLKPSEQLLKFAADIVINLLIGV